MKSFLELVASDLQDRFHGDYRKLVIVFPNKRASLFFNQHIAAHAQHPIWAPQYASISALLRRMVPLEVADPIMLVCELFNAYKAVTQSDETLDDFYFWGETMLADFDDADKQMANTDQLFANMADLGKFDDFSFLSDTQRKAIETFFNNARINQDSQLKQNFATAWNALGDIYKLYRTNLAHKGMAYEGMLYRMAVEQLEDNDIMADGLTYVFVGFNVLNQVEQRLFKVLQKANKALFYWDYDTWYASHVASTEKREAGEFMRRNLAQFPSALPPQHFNNLDQDKEIRIITASSENQQARFLPQWLNRHLTTYDEKKTAVVLCDETLLLPVTYSIPSCVHDVNITMGYPLSQTYVGQQVATLTHHMVHSSELAGIVAQTEALRDNPSVSQSALEREALFRAYSVLTRFQTLVDDGTLRIQPDTLRTLLWRVLHATSIPFHGEPAQGLQVMGVLETRNLDFDHIIMLSVTDGMLPRVGNEISFIPQNLRHAFGLTTMEHKIAVYAYYFYRLLQRANHVTMVYNNSNADNARPREMSRFLLQLLVEWNHPIGQYTLTTTQMPSMADDKQVEKTTDVMNRLLQRYVTRQSRLSPTALNAYLMCPLKFFYRYVANLDVPTPTDQAITPAQFGDIFHHAVAEIYTNLASTNQVVSPDELSHWAKHPSLVEDCVRKHFMQTLFPDCNSHHNAAINGIHRINLSVLCNMVRTLLDYDAKHAPLHYLGAETQVSCLMSIDINGQKADIKLGGDIDRLDCTNGTLRVVDYKTGGKTQSVQKLDTLFRPNEKSHPSNEFQAMLYCYILRHASQTDANQAVAMCKQMPLVPAILHIKELNNDVNPILKIDKNVMTDFTKYQSSFHEKLVGLLTEIFSPEIPFTQTTERTHCQYCDFRQLCGR